MNTTAITANVQPYPVCWSIIWRQYRDLPDQQKHVVYEDAKRQRQLHESMEVPVTESYSDFCNRVARDLEL